MTRPAEESLVLEHNSDITFNELHFGIWDTQSESYLQQATRSQLSNLLPPEGDFLAIIIDALDGNDEVTVGPTVVKSVWIDGGAGGTIPSRSCPADPS